MGRLAVNAVSSLLVELERLGVELETRGDRLRFRPVDAVPENLVQALRKHKTELLSRLRSSSGPGALLVDEDDQINQRRIADTQARSLIGSVRIHSHLLDSEIWLALDEHAASELRVEEEGQERPRPVLTPEDIIALERMSPAKIRAAVEWIRRLPMFRVIQ